MENPVSLLCLFLFTSMLVCACGNLPYYKQAVDGHFELMSKRKPVDDILADDNGDAELIRQLEVAKGIRDFASTDLALPDNGSYRSYVDLGRDSVTWAVFATPEFSLTPQLWCFPFAGCVPYRGYFSKQEAERFADGLRDEGFDVHLGGTTAYSTLGWFDDPLLNTMMLRGETGMAGIIFHELAHQAVYVEDDTTFNEAFAVAVQEEGVRRWLQAHGSAGSLQAYEQALVRKSEFIKLVRKTREHLQEVYASDRSEDELPAAKLEAFKEMRAQYQRLKDSWEGSGGYDWWFYGSLNNAKLAAVSVYRDLVPDFNRLLDACDGEFDRFYQAVERLGTLDPKTRLRTLNAATCNRAIMTHSEQTPAI
jgi:predicted aminopeptidase